jgi:uncharacterized protein YbjQ (UPF0145 family)
MEAFIQLGVVAALLAIGLLLGSLAERRHYRSLREREAALRHLLVFNERRPPADQAFRHATLVIGSVVIAEDYFKRAAAALKNLFGGRLTVYESLMDRGRREALVRMKEEAQRRGASMVFNVRFETAMLSENRPGRNALFSAEFIAYGTALVP